MVTSEPQHPLPLLPVGHVKTGIVDTWVIETLRCLGNPWMQKVTEVFTGHHGFSPINVSCTRKQHADSIDLHANQSLDAVIDDSFLAPAHQPKGGGTVEKVVLARAFPNEMPGVFGIHTHRASSVAVGGAEGARVRHLEIALPVSDRVRIVARRGWHEADSENAAICRVAEALDSR